MQRFLLGIMCFVAACEVTPAIDSDSGPLFAMEVTEEELTEEKAMDETCKKQPLILLHGSGPPDRARGSIDLLEANLNYKPIHRINYDWTRSHKETAREVAKKIEDIISQYPDCTRFHIAGHSLGHFIAIYTILTHGLDDRFDTVIGIAGVAKGLYQCPGRLISRIIKRYLSRTSPAVDILYDAKWLDDFYAKHAKRIARLRMISLSAPRDRLVPCSVSGDFDSGKNISVLTSERSLLPVYIHYLVAEHPETARVICEQLPRAE